MILFKSIIAVILMWEILYYSYRLETGDFFDF